MRLTREKAAPALGAWTASGLALGLALFAGGCGDDDAPLEPESGAPPDTFVQAEHPAKAYERLLETYGAQSAIWYANTLTSDFRYSFSSSGDPDLVMQFGTDWGRAHEDSAAVHLFDGFPSSAGYLAGARTIETSLGTFIVDPDLEHGDSVSYYATVSAVPVLIDVTLDDDLVYQIGASFRFWVVRGDAAVLGPGQEADADHWYVRRIEDFSNSPIGLPREHRMLLPGQATTWGRLRAAYLGAEPSK